MANQNTVNVILFDGTKSPGPPVEDKDGFNGFDDGGRPIFDPHFDFSCIERARRRKAWADLLAQIGNTQ
jgi:hypothetical protein